MKTKMAIAALFLMIGAANAMAGGQTPSLKISRPEGSSTFLVQYESAQANDVSLTIKDESGRVVATQSIRSVKGFLLPVNLEGAEAGIYTIEVSNKMDKQIEQLDYSFQTPATYTHVTALGDHRYMLSVTHTGSEKINIRILDGAQNSLFEQEQLVNGSFARVYDLKDIVGVPSFEVTDSSSRSLVIK